MKLFLICSLMFSLGAFVVSPLAHANEEESASDSIESEQLVLDATADEGAAKDAKELAKHAEEEAREMKKKSMQEERAANKAKVTAKAELERAEAQHVAAQEKIKKWKVEHSIWEKRRQKYEEQIAKARADEQVTQEQIKAAKQAVDEAHEATLQAQHARDEALRIQHEAEAEMRRLAKEVKAAKAEEARAKAPIASNRRVQPEPASVAQVATAPQAEKPARNPSANWQTLPRDCNLREQANSGANSLGPVLKGAKLQAKAAGPKWLRVNTEDGKSGFMAAFCFK